MPHVQHCEPYISFLPTIPVLRSRRSSNALAVHRALTTYLTFKLVLTLTHSLPGHFVFR
jgi:hypothetical protein